MHESLWPRSDAGYTQVLQVLEIKLEIMPDAGSAISRGLWKAQGCMTYLWLQVCRSGAESSEISLPSARFLSKAKVGITVKLKGISACYFSALHKSPNGAGRKKLPPRERDVQKPKKCVYP